jgi:hypothetical protein
VTQQTDRLSAALTVRYRIERHPREAEAQANLAGKLPKALRSVAAIGLNTDELGYPPLHVASRRYSRREP